MPVNATLLASVSYTTSTEFQDRYDLVGIGAVADLVRFQSLWFWGTYTDVVIGHSANLYAGDAQAPHSRSVALEAAAALSLGLPPCKVLLAIPTYGFGWQLATQPVTPSFPALYSVPVNHSWDVGSDAGMFVDQDVFGTFTPANGWVEIWDSTAHASVWYHAAMKRVVSYESTRAAAEKAQWAGDRGLAGVTVEDLHGDSHGNYITRAMSDQLAVSRPCVTPSPPIDRYSAEPCFPSAF
jgi:GH18 family chitinase